MRASSGGQPVIEARPLGSTGIVVSALGMGCGKLGSVWHQRPDKEGKDAVSEALDSGITFFDTADCYGLGRSERLLGDIVNRDGKRSEVVIATKCGLVKTPTALLRAVSSLLPAINEPALGARLPTAAKETARLIHTRSTYSPRYIERSVDASLRRLRTDYIDILLLHSPPTPVLESGAFGETFDRLKRKGKIRVSGLSLRTAADALNSIGRPGVDCIQLEVNLCTSRRTDTSTVISKAAKAGVAVIARQPFASGAFLESVPNVALGPLAPDHSSTVRKACLQSALVDKRVSVVIAGMTFREHVHENVSAAMAEPLPEGLIDEIRVRMCRQAT
jgi:aryl-alcohol dehydrogenase-like predicted oxidoreductase